MSLCVCVCVCPICAMTKPVWFCLSVCGAMCVCPLNSGVVGFPMFLPNCPGSAFLTTVGGAGESRHLCLLSDLREQARSPSPSRVTSAVGSSLMLYFRVREFLLVSWVFSLWRGLELGLMLVCIYWDDPVVFDTYSINGSLCLFIFRWKATFLSWVKSHVVLLFRLFFILLNSLYKYFVEAFFIYVKNRYGQPQWLSG